MFGMPRMPPQSGQNWGPDFAQPRRDAAGASGAPPAATPDLPKPAPITTMSDERVAFRGQPPHPPQHPPPPHLLPHPPRHPLPPRSSPRCASPPLRAGQHSPPPSRPHPRAASPPARPKRGATTSSRADSPPPKRSPGAPLGTMESPVSPESAAHNERSASPPTNASWRQMGRSNSPPPMPPSKHSPARRTRAFKAQELQEEGEETRSGGGSRGGEEAEGAEGRGGGRPGPSSSPAADGGVAEAPPVSSGGPIAVGGLEWDVGAVLEVTWKAEKATFRGAVEAAEDGVVLVYYASDNTHQWHDFDVDECTYVVVEPAAHALARIRRTHAGYDGQVVPGARWYAMEPTYVERHFERCGESVWLGRLGDDFVDLPLGSRRRTGTEGLARPPYCVLGSLAAVLAHMGNRGGADLAKADAAASLQLRPGLSRLTWAATRAHVYQCEPRTVHMRALAGTAGHPTLLMVSRSHVVAVLGHTLFDAEEGALALTQANLDRCVGAQCTTAVVRGYEFVPLLLTNKRPADALGGADGQLICQECQHALSKSAFSKSQLRKKDLRRCSACVQGQQAATDPRHTQLSPPRQPQAT